MRLNQHFLCTLLLCGELLMMTCTLSGLGLLEYPTQAQAEKSGDSADEQTRAAQWANRREKKRQQSVVSGQSGLEKFLARLEDDGFRRILSIRYKDFYPKFGNLSPGAGLSGGVRYYKSGFLHPALSLETSSAVSVAGYRFADLQFGHFDKIAPFLFLGPADFGAPFDFFDREVPQKNSFLYTEFRYRFFPREVFFGLGNESRPQDRTSFLMEGGVVDLVAGYRPKPWLAAAVRTGYAKVNTGPGEDERFPTIGEVFDDITAPGLGQQPDFFHLDSAVYLSYLGPQDRTPNGGLLGLSLARFDDLGGHDYQFNRYTIDARHYLRLGSRQRVLALRFLTSVDDAADSSRVPFYLQTPLGGNETLRGFREFRFRDTNRLYLSAEYRWTPAPAIEFAFFYDAGKVFPGSIGYSFRGLKKSIGGGVRFKAANRTFLRFDIGRGREGTQVHFRFGPSF